MVYRVIEENLKIGHEWCAHMPTFNKQDGFLSKQLRKHEMILKVGNTW